eukprot:CAMPEP_0114338308 /NCGR_PEP_ID=MMETSP0101-20121206/6952_1 /TAXON_ID=38822 ORGANISM="Pteridomonas danica, Strain PT" /NCGR_SAMPLE_ID=MMETSP0101 /ASSEMBLY_ACC=CAM_ASM_000211 /LENGTH=63 /DNA_ID=CAMNT_0001470851 /DNA_START=229 /DNA_END=420 /DNA_ORIENTATION=-
MTQHKGGIEMTSTSKQKGGGNENIEKLLLQMNAKMKVMELEIEKLSGKKLSDPDETATEVTRV